jgi:hypothetical protein
MLYKNFATSRVVTAPSPASSGTSLVITTGEGVLFPTVPFNAIVWPVGESPIYTNSEIVTVTVKSTDTLTIVRSQEATNARNIVIGDRIAASITAYTARTFRFLNPVVVSATHTLLDNEDIVICNSASNFTVNLLEATGSGRVVHIKNKNTGMITIEGYSTNTIDGELNQTINENESLQICDYAAGLWAVV